jgi:hypothetical protein
MSTSSNNWYDHLNHLFDAELQFRLAAAVRIAVTCERQPLDFPEEWSHGHVKVRYEDMSLRQDQAEIAAQVMQHSATHIMAVAVKDAIEAVAPALPDALKKQRATPLEAVREAIAKSAQKPWKVTEDLVAAAYHVSRLIRNAYAHSPFAPRWSINSQLQNETFAIPNVIELRASGLHGKDFDWQHYGGLLALFQLCRFTRYEILGEERRERTNIPSRQRTIYQLGDMIMEQIDQIPAGYVRAVVTPNADGSIDLGHGYRIAPPEHVKTVDDDDQAPGNRNGADTS